MTRRKETLIEVPPSQFLTDALATLSQTQEEKVKQLTQANADIKAAEKHLKGMGLHRDYSIKMFDNHKLKWNHAKKRIQIEVETPGEYNQTPTDLSTRNLIECPVELRMQGYAMLVDLINVIAENLVEETK